MFRPVHRRLRLRNRLQGLPALVIAAALGLCSSEASALDPEKPTARYRLRAWTAAVDPPPTPTAALAQTPDGHLWIASHLGLIRFDGFHKRMVMPSSEVMTSLATDRVGNLWIGTEHGLSRLDVGATTPVATSLAGTRIVAVVAGDDGAWAGTGSTVYRVTRSAEPTAIGEYAGVVTRLGQDGSNLWVGTSEGIVRQTLRTNEQTAFTTDQGLLSNSVQDIYVHAPNDVWVGTGAGLNRIFEGEVRSYHGREDFSDGAVTVVYGDLDKNIWVGVGDRGLYRFTNNRFEHLGSGAGLSSPRVTALAEDHEGGLWIGSAEGTIDRLDDPPVFAPPPVQFRGVMFDGVPAATSPGKPLTIPESVHTVGVEFSAPRFSNRTGVAFRHRLVGFDPDWREVGDRTQVNYSGLPPGAYTFELMTSLSGGPWEPVGGAQEWVREGVAPGSRFGWLMWCLVGGLLTGIGVTVVQIVRTRKSSSPSSSSSTGPRPAPAPPAPGPEHQPPASPVQASLEPIPEAVTLLQELPELAWLEPQAVELARCLGAMALKVFEISGEGGFQTLAGRGVRVAPPTLDDVNDSARSGELVERSGNTLLGLRNGDGAVLGAIVVCGRGAPWDVDEQRLLAAFSRQLTATLELRALQAHQDLVQTQRREAQKTSTRGDEQLQMCTTCRRCYPKTARRCGYDGGRLKPLSTPYRFHDRYTLSRFLGQGGMGRVYEARDERLDREVAIKIIRGEHLRDETVQMRLVQEAKTVARISHPGVIALHDFGELGDGSTYLVMEKLKGSD
ncbi:MAG: two-component regulator propeller domain-containing protein, partial [Nannocystaceae bacterium]